MTQPISKTFPTLTAPPPLPPVPEPPPEVPSTALCTLKAQSVPGNIPGQVPLSTHPQEPPNSAGHPAAALQDPTCWGSSRRKTGRKDVPTGAG